MRTASSGEVTSYHLAHDYLKITSTSTSTSANSWHNSRCDTYLSIEYYSDSAAAGKSEVGLAAIAEPASVLATANLSFRHLLRFQ